MPRGDTYFLQYPKYPVSYWASFLVEGGGDEETVVFLLLPEGSSVVNPSS